MAQAPTCLRQMGSTTKLPSLEIVPSTLNPVQKCKNPKKKPGDSNEVKHFGLAFLPVLAKTSPCHLHCLGCPNHDRGDQGQ